MLATTLLKCGSLLPQNLVQRLALCELIDKLVHITNLPHERMLDVLYTHPAHHALISVAFGLKAGAKAKKVSKSFPDSICCFSPSWL